MLSDSSKQTPSKVPRPWGFGAIILACGAFVVCQLFVSALFVWLFGETLPIAGHFYMYALASLFALGALGLILRHYHTRVRDLGVGRFELKHLGQAILSWPAYIIIGYICMTLAMFLVPNFDPHQIQDLGFPEVQRTIELLFVFVALVLIPPFVEELLFRGFIFKGLLKHFSPVVAAIATSVLFGVAHGQWNVGVDTFALSLVLCFLAYRTKSLWPAIALHMLKNFIAFTFVFLITPSQLRDFLLRLGH